MTLQTDIASDVQTPDPGELVTMYELDTSLVGGDIYRFTSSQFEDKNVTYNTNIYYPFPVEEDGFEFNGKGQLPRPKIRIGLIGTGQVLVMREAVRDGQDLVGCKLTRRRTFRKYLDGEAEASYAAQFPADVYVIERKTRQDNEMVEFELSAYMDFEGKKIPGRQVLRDICTHRYRIYSDGDFDYTDVTCPYTGDSYFKVDGESTETASEDDCGRKLSDCKLRHPNANLPTRAFPGVARTRVR